MSTRSYQEAVEHLNRLQSNAATIEATRASGGRLEKFAMPEMIEYLERIGHTPEGLNALNVIHVTGTKGKGSTCAFTDSVLRRAMPSWKVGLYTSPHLVAVRERIRINGIPISEEEFAHYFFEVWDGLEKNPLTKNSSTPLMPGYFRFLTLLAFHAFLDLKVNATILEVGIGGAYDSTNIVPKPIVTGITALGIDHVAVLGKTLEEIAWNKGGIYKEGVPALTVNQPKLAMAVLEQRAKELKFTPISLIPGLSEVRLGLAGSHQIQNANMALHLVHKFLQSRRHHTYESALPKLFIEGLKSTKWPGRCQIVQDPRHENLTWYLDGAHTPESLTCCMQWFMSPGIGISSSVTSGKPTQRILVFNCTGGRSGQQLLKVIQENVASLLASYGDPQTPFSFFSDVIFCTNVTFADGHFKGDLTSLAIPPGDLASLKAQQELSSAWSRVNPLFPVSHIHVLPSIEHAVKKIKSIEEQAQAPTKILVTGSLHLVGGLMEVANLSEQVL